MMKKCNSSIIFLAFCTDDLKIHVAYNISEILIMGK